MNELTEEQQKESAERRTQFLDRYKALIDELQMDFASFPVFVPNERGSFELMINTELVDKKYMALKSPIIVSEQ